jgi:transcriptional regulator with XRE-family HTH domain
VIEEANISKSYFYKIRNGEKLPSRDTLIQICFGLDLNLEETNLLLNKTGYNALYLRNVRDVIIAYHIENNSNLTKVNIELENYGVGILGDVK